MRKILMSLGMIAFVGAVVVGGTGAFFNDTETSTGNVFTAGAIDLLIDNESYVTNNEGVLVFSEETSWELDDLDGHLFFNFDDLKPGDIGEDTISIHVNNNDAWVCAAAQVTSDNDVSCTEPELDDDQSCTDPEEPGASDNFDGELGSQLIFAFWGDDGDNVYENDEVIFTGGSAANLGGQGQIALADSQSNVWGELAPVPGGETVYIAKAWCFGNGIPTPVQQDGEVDNGPLDPDPNSEGQPRGTGFTCDGGPVDNSAQTDQLTVDLQFYAVQSRNNAEFLCSSDYQPDFPEQELPVVGAEGLVGYVAPAQCDVTVTDNDNLQTVITNATQGTTICVEDGTYNEFTVDKPLTIAGLTNPNTGSAKIVPSGTGVTELALVTSSDVTITGLHFDGEGTAFDGNQTAGVQISPVSSSIDNVNIVYNIIENLLATNGNAANKGIQWFTEGDTGYSLTNSSFSYNVIDDITSTSKGGYGIQTVGDMDGMTIMHNTISNIDGAWEAGIAFDTKDTALTTLSAVSVIQNQIMDSIDNDLSVQVEYSVDATGISVNQNNLEGLVHGGGNAVLGTEGTLDAENNWWGDADPSDDTLGDVDYIPFKFVAFPTV